MQRFFDNIFAYYDSLLLIGSDEITKRLQMCLNNPQCGHKDGEEFPIFGEITIKASPAIYIYIYFTCMPQMKQLKLIADEIVSYGSYQNIGCHK